MFTGLIEHIGVVAGVRRVGGALELRIDLGPLAEGLEPGDSVAVDGTCQTATKVQGSQVSFSTSVTTLAITTLGDFTVGRRVNLERPITLQDRLGGHLVAGHIDGVVTLERFSPSGQGKIGHFRALKSITDFMISKGSVALNGVSLTVAELRDGAFSVALIPESLARTNLGKLGPGQKVNIETDLIGKYIAKFMAVNRGPGGPGLSMETLKEQGFA